MKAAIEITLNVICDNIVDCEHKTAPTQDYGISSIRTTDIKNGIIDFENANKVSDKVYQEWTNRLEPKPNDIILAREAPVGEVGIIPKGRKACLGQRTVLIRPNPQLVNPSYLLYLLVAPILKHEMCSRATGSTVEHLNMSDIRELKMPPLPNLNEQKQIATILSTLDQKIALLKKQNQTLEELAQTLFKRWFVDFEFPDEQGKPYKSSGGKVIASELGEIPEGWRVGVFNDIIDFSNGYAFKSSDLLSDRENNCYDVFKMGNIKKGGGFIPEKTKSFIHRDNCTGLDKYVLKTGDLLMSMTDMKDNVSLLGHTALMPVNEKYIVNQRVGLIRSHNDIGIEYPYLYLLTNSRIFIAEIRSKANSGVQVNLSTEGIKNSKLIIPSKTQNQQFHSIAEPSFEKMAKNQNTIQSLTQLRDTLLPKLMSGQLRIETESLSRV